MFSLNASGRPCPIKDFKPFVLKSCNHSLLYRVTLHGASEFAKMMLCFQGWYPVSATLWSFGYELPERVQMTFVSKNSLDTIVACGGTLWFSAAWLVIESCQRFSNRRNQTGRLSLCKAINRRGLAKLFPTFTSI